MKSEKARVMPPVPLIAALTLTGLAALAWCAGQAQAIGYGGVRVGIEDRGIDVEEGQPGSAGSVQRRTAEELAADRAAGGSERGLQEAGSMPVPGPDAGEGPTPSD